MSPKEYPPTYQHPGDTTVVGDSQGAQAAIICVEHPQVLDFIEACKDWMELTAMPIQVTDETLTYAMRKVTRTFNKLPAHVWREIERRNADNQGGISHA